MQVCVAALKQSAQSKKDLELTVMLNCVRRTFIPNVAFRILGEINGRSR